MGFTLLAAARSVQEIFVKKGNIKRFKLETAWFFYNYPENIAGKGREAVGKINMKIF